MMYEHKISKKLVETQNGLFWDGLSFQMLNPYAVTTIIENIDLRTPEDVTLLNTLSIGKQFYIIKIDFLAQAILKTSLLQQTPRVNVGFLNPYNQLLSAYDLKDLENDKQYLQELLAGVRTSVDPGKPLVLRKSRVSTYAQFKIAVRIVGYYK